MDFVKYLSDYVGVIAEKQRVAAKLVGDRQWNVDINARTLAFSEVAGSDPIVFQADLVGSEDPSSGRYQWAWTMTGAVPSDEVKGVSRQLRSWGETRSFREFTTEGWIADRTRTASAMTALAAGVLNADGYFLAPSTVGPTAHFVLRSPLLQLGEPDVTALARVVIDIPESYPVVDHRRAVLAYFHARGVETSQPMNRVVGVTPSGKKIRVMFDELGRISNLQGDFALPDGVQLST